jgi:AcrR family transcriptional regulator
MTQRGTRSQHRKAERARPPPGHRRPGGRTRLQQEQKDATRQRLLRAAAVAFAEGSYAGTPVEEIITRAGASRTSFYRHFDSKWSVASALCDEVMPSVWQLWRELAAFGDPTEAQIAEWLTRRLALYGAHRALFATLREAVAIEPIGNMAVAETHDETIRVLANGIPAFALALGTRPFSQELRVRAHLLLMQLDEFNSVLAIRGWDVDRALAVRVMAQQFRRYIESAEALERHAAAAPAPGAQIAGDSSG